MKKKEAASKAAPRKRAATQPDVSSAPVLLLDMNELASTLRLSPWSARRLVELGQIPAVEMPAVGHGARRRDRDQRMRRVLVSVRDVQDFVERSRKTSAD